MKWSLAAAVLSIAALGCSGQEVAGQPADGGFSADGGVEADQSAEAEAAAPDVPDASADVRRRDGFVDIFDVFPIPDGLAGGCATCVRDQCGTQVNDCVNSDVCRNGLTCTVMNCVATGTPDLTCILGCFNGDTAAAFAAIGALMCVNSSCGSVCMAALDGGGPADSSRPSDGASADGVGPSDDGAVDAHAGDDAAFEANVSDAIVSDAIISAD